MRTLCSVFTLFDLLRATDDSLMPFQEQIKTRISKDYFPLWPDELYGEFWKRSLDGCGWVYAIQSCRSSGAIYIGATSRLKQRLNEHWRHERVPTSGGWLICVERYSGLWDANRMEAFYIIESYRREVPLFNKAIPSDWLHPLRNWSYPDRITKDAPK